HRAATPDGDRGLEFLLEHIPAALHLVLATRADPSLPLTRLRVQGKIAELHAADLRFSPDEASRFMSETMHIVLPPDQLAQLNERTEGWVAGLQLAALSLRDQASIPDRVADLSSTPRYIAEYLIDEVLERQPPDVQTFLLQTAMLERLSGPLCDAVTGRTDSAAMLARLTQAQLFVTPLDAARTWYRYHQLFADVLCQRLRTTAPDLLEQSHRRAAHWLQQHGMLDEAIQHFLAVPAFEDAATLIEGESDRLVLRGEVAGLVSWARTLPRDVLLRHPHLCVLFATGLFLQGRPPEASAWMDDLERYLRETVQHPVETEGEIATVRAIMLLISGDVDGGAALARQATMQLSPENHLMSGMALWITNMLDLFGEDDISESSRTITEIAEQSIRAGNILVAVMALFTNVSIEISQCRLHRAAQTAREAIRLASDPSGRELPLAAIGYCTLGEIEREWNDLDAAERTLHHALEVGSYLSSPEFVNDGLVSLAMVHAARGRCDEALAVFEEIRRLVQAQQLVTWDVIQMEVMRVRVLIAQGHSVEIARWIDDYRRNWQMERPHRLILLRESQDLALARAALALGQTSELVATLQALSETASRAGRLRNVMEAKMLLARARWMTGDRDAAVCDLDAALTLAAPDGFMRVFLDEGQSMADLLAAYVATHPHSTERTHALKLLAAFGRSIEPSPPFPTPSVTLSQREHDVLQLLAVGYSNEAIAAELVVALSTVKWHVAHIYRKLSVTSRVQAVARAHDLHLIA
ncbi:MAG: LuxR C-terminal-related transcriptional regulator, partial [Ktedonobacterales bacterium]